MNLAHVALHGVKVDDSILTRGSTIGVQPAREAIVNVKLFNRGTQRCWDKRQGIDGQAMAELHPLVESVITLSDIVIGQDVPGCVGLTESDTAAATLEKVNTAVPPEPHVLKHVVRHKIAPARLKGNTCT